MADFLRKRLLFPMTTFLIYLNKEQRPPVLLQIQCVYKKTVKYELEFNGSRSFLCVCVVSTEEETKIKWKKRKERGGKLEEMKLV